MKLKVTVHGVAYEVDVEIIEDDGIFSSPLPNVQPSNYTQPATPPTSPVRPLPTTPTPSQAGSAADGSSVTAPIAGTIVEVNVKVGQEVKVNDVVLVLEAMKMNTDIYSPVSGKVKKINAGCGEAVKEGFCLIEFE